MTGRNERCPCGSGKKYKKCCLHSDDKFVDQYTDAIVKLSEQDQPCLLCEKTPANIQGIFQPSPESDDYHKFDVPENKVRITGYKLCESCFSIEKDERTDLIEQKIIDKINKP